MKPYLIPLGLAAASFLGAEARAQEETFSFSGPVTFLENGGAEPDYSYTATVTYDPTVAPSYTDGESFESVIYPDSVVAFEYNIYDPLGVLVVSEVLEDPEDADHSFVGSTTAERDFEDGTETISWHAALFRLDHFSGTRELLATATVGFIADGDLIDNILSYPEPPRLANVDDTFVSLRGDDPFTLVYLATGTIETLSSSNSLIDCKLSANRVNEYRRCVSDVVKDMHRNGEITGREIGSVMSDTGRNNRLFRRAD